MAMHDIVLRPGLGISVAKFLIGGFLTLSLAGCALFKEKTPEVKTYTLSPAQMSSHTQGKNGSLLISTPVASPGYDTAHMVYVKRPYQLQNFTENAWVAPPAQLLLPLLEQSFKNRGCFRTVSTAPFAGEANYMLNTQLLKLQQVFYENYSEVQLVMDATLIDNLSHESMAHRRFTATVAASQNAPYAGVVAANQAAARVLRQIVDFVCEEKSKQGG